MRQWGEKIVNTLFLDQELGMLSQRGLTLHAAPTAGEEEEQRTKAWAYGGEHGNICAGTWGLVLAEGHPLLRRGRP